MRALHGVEQRLRKLAGEPAPEEMRLAAESPLRSLMETVSGVVHSYRDLPRQFFIRQSLASSEAASAWEEVLSTVSLSASKGTSSAGEVFAWLEGLGWLVRQVEADSQLPGCRVRALMVEEKTGGSRLIVCRNCGYGAEADIAVFRRVTLQGGQVPAEEVATPGATTIPALAEQLGIASSEVGKIVVLASRDAAAATKSRLVMAVVQGEVGVSETKLRHATGLPSFRPASEDELKSHGIVPGYGSPLGARDVLVVADEAVAESPGLVMGANREGFHKRGVVCGREYHPDLVADIASAEPGHTCRHCGAGLAETRGICVARRATIQSTEDESLGCSFATQEWESRPVQVEWIEVRVGRILEAAAAVWGEESGLHLPSWLSPCMVHLVVLDGGEETAAWLIELLAAEHVEALVDDRAVSAGVKFADADWLGIPVRVVLGRRGQARGIAEVAVWSGAEWRREEVSLPSLATHLVQALAIGP